MDFSVAQAQSRGDYSSNDRMARAYDSGAADSSLISSRVKHNAFKIGIFTASLLDDQH